MNARRVLIKCCLASLFCFIGGVAAGESAPDGAISPTCQTAELAHCTSGCREAFYHFVYPATVAIPGELAVIEGNAGQGLAELRFQSAATRLITTCTYQGAASSPHPSTTDDLAIGLRYALVGCDQGDPPAATLLRVASVSLKVFSGDESQGITKASIRLGDHDSCPELADGSEFGVETRFAFGPEAGELIIDASGNKPIFPIPLQARVFRNWDDFFVFAQSQLNAEIVINDDGSMAAQGKTIEWEHGMYVNQRSGQLMEVTDPVAAFLGGTKGYVEIAGERIPLSPDSIRPWEGPAAATAPEQRDICAGSFCTRNTSFKHDYRFYFSRGSETEQRSGGYQVSHHFCWKYGFIPWVCSSSSGSNSLRIADAYFIVSPPAVPAPVWYRRTSVSNVTDLTEKIWMIGFVPSMVRDISGVCGAHASSGTGGQVPDVNTAAGYTTDCF